MSAMPSVRAAPPSWLALASAAALLGACAADTSEAYAGVPLAPGAADPEIQSLARRAASGDKKAQLELGMRYEQGRGVPRDERRAEALYERAARSSGGTVLVYNPPAGPGQAGFVQHLDHGPLRPGLAEAVERLARLREGARRSRHRSGMNPHPEHQQ